MPIVFQEWLNANEGRAYPINDRASRLDKNAKLLPNNIIADANIWLPKSAGRSVYLASVGLSPNLVSLTFAATDFTFCEGASSSSGTPSFVPLAVLSLTKPITRFKNYPLQAIYPGAGGWVAFGSGALSDLSIQLLFDNPEMTLMLDRCVRAFNDIPVLSISKLNLVNKLTGLVRLKGQAGVTRTFKTQRLIQGVERDVAAIGLDLSVNKVATLQEFAGECGHRPQNGDCNKAPLTEINGVKPDGNGNINIRFVGDAVPGGGDGAIVIDFPLGLANACIDQGFKLYLEGCPPEEPSSSSSSSQNESDPDDVGSSSLSGPSSSSTSDEPNPCFGNCYCETFENGYGEMAVVEGPMPLVLSEGTTRLATPPGIVGPVYANATLRPQTLSEIGEFFVLKTKMKPTDAQNGEGHFIFSWRNPNNFFFAGLTLKPSSSALYPYPNGSFFVGKKVLSTLNWPAALGQGYNFLAGARFNAPVALIPTDYDMTLIVTKISASLIEIRLMVDYVIGGTPYSFDSGSSIIVPESVAGQPFFNLRGNVGVGGIYAPNTQFDLFGINCNQF